jgi:UDPglucose 6-dehydrogenase
MEQAKPLMPKGITWCRDAMEAATGADALVLITEWNEFRAISPAKLKGTMAGDIVIDLRNVWDPKAMREAGFRYSSIGRP